MYDFVQVVMARGCFDDTKVIQIHLTLHLHLILWAENLYLLWEFHCD